MARRKGFVGMVGRVAREMERAHRRAVREAEKLQREQERAIAKAERERRRLQREEERAIAREEREQQRLQRHEERAIATAEREEKRRHQEQRQAEAEEMNASLEHQIAELSTLLSTSLDRDHNVDISSLLDDIPHTEAARFQAALTSEEPRAIAEYFHMVLNATPYPEGFPGVTRVAYVPDSRQLVVELDYPPLSIVPTVKTYRHIKTRDEIKSTRRPRTEINAIYNSAIARITLRTIHETFEADKGKWVDVIVFNGHVHTVDPGTGKSIHPCLISLRTTSDVFHELELARVDPVACLKGLHAAVSRNPGDLSPVRPVLEFSMVDPRYVEETDIISELDSRVNLMELTPLEFEGLISNLFECMGLDTRQTRPSRDGGVDCVAYDSRPILGGKVVIQAKRYKNTVGVSAVRDLFGTLQNEGASKGILVTTSGFGKASYEFAEGKPIELLDGANLLYLLLEHAGLEARIEAPDDWTDPSPDSFSSAT